MQVDKPIENGILEEFRIEFLEVWNGLPNKAFFLILLAAWLAVFQLLGNSTLGFVHSPSLLKWMFDVYHPSSEALESEDQHGLIVPFVVLGILWWKRKELLGLSLRTWSPALFLLGFAVLMHVLGYTVQQPRISIIALFTGIYALAGLAWGPRWLRATFFPFFLFAFCVPLGTLAQPITFRLRIIVCQLVEAVCHYILVIDVVRDGTALRDPTGHYQYEVAAACSGIRSLVAISLMATVYGFGWFSGFWKRFVVVASALPLAILGNLVRMLSIVIAAEIGGQKLGNSVHDSAVFSMLPYIPAILGLLMLGRWLQEAPQKPRQTATAVMGHHEAAATDGA
jgi:exosortase